MACQKKQFKLDPNQPLNIKEIGVKISIHLACSEKIEKMQGGNRQVWHTNMLQNLIENLKIGAAEINFRKLQTYFGLTSFVELSRG